VASYYEMLDVVPTASADEIKRAFRREIAKYHPDKVQHLGREFQEIAAVKAAELTQAYKTLSDESLRTDYDAQLKAAQIKVVRAAAAPAQPPYPAPPAERSEWPSERRPSTDAGKPPTATRDRGGATDLVRKAAVQRFRHAVQEEFGQCEEPPIAGFDFMGTPPKGGFLSRTVPPRLLARVVDQVDYAAVQESWGLAVRLRRDDQREACLFIMGPSVAPAGELGRAINEQRRKPMPPGLKLVVVPVNTRTWSAHIPTDAPAQVKQFLARLASGL
jgi:curved DNA-binding protein CbpA